MVFEYFTLIKNKILWYLPYIKSKVGEITNNVAILILLFVLSVQKLMVY